MPDVHPSLSMGLIVTFIVVTKPIAVALPLPDEAEPSWGPEPKGRGTVSIVLPCLITLGLCVWTAIHPNINSRPTTLRIFGIKLI
ncbi:hypothetical protein K440DRAFT_598998 [Wilcoxina mikolae CBS 423.85]|nr:hypothetical protein K440DRAFT_598998 [Wilcoxina mikolae CBS 423.85]